jgi:hypothetical protein
VRENVASLLEVGRTHATNRYQLGFDLADSASAIQVYLAHQPQRYTLDLD